MLRKDSHVLTMTSVVLIPRRQVLQELMTIMCICRVAMYVRGTYLSLKQPNVSSVIPILQERNEVYLSKVAQLGLELVGCQVSVHFGDFLR